MTATPPPRRRQKRPQSPTSRRAERLAAVRAQTELGRARTESYPPKKGTQ